MRTSLLICGLAIGLLAYSLYHPVPDYVQDRSLLAFRDALLKALVALGRVMEFFNLGSFESDAHRSNGLAFPPPGNTSSVTFTYRQFAGSRTLVATPAAAAAPGSGGGAAAVVYIHGGGWAFGAPEMYPHAFAEIVEKTGVVIFAIRYRLAPEHKFPAAFDDCLAATEAIFESAKSSGVDPSRIAIAGDSAGGQLAASVVQQLRRAGSRHRPKMQVLLYPVTQVVNVRTESYLSQSDAPILRFLHMHNFISLYLTGSKTAARWILRHGHVTDKMRSVYEKATGSLLPTAVDGSGTSDDVSDSVASRMASVATDFRFSPLLGDQLEKLDLPPAHILACEFDPLFEDSVMYAKRLERSGVRTHLRRFHTYHGAMDMPTDGREIRDHFVHIFRTL